MSYPPPPPASYPPPTGAWSQKPNNYLVWSILTTLFCCLPLGIVAIIQSTKVDSLWSGGQVAAAQEASVAARKWNLWGLGIGVLAVVAYLLLMMAGLFASSN